MSQGHKRQNYLRNLMLGTVAAGLLGIFGGAAPAWAAAKGSKVILLTVSQSCEYCALHERAFLKAAAADGINVEVKINNFDAGQQASQVDQAVAEHPDAIVVWPADASAIVPSLRRIKKAGIPLVVTNSMPNPKYQSLWNIYTGPDDLGNGQQAGEAMIQGLKAKGYTGNTDIFVILGVLGTPPQINRLDGFTGVLKAKAPMVKIDGSQPGNWDQTQATDAAAALFTQYGAHIKGVYAEADNMLAGVIVAAQRAGLDPKTLVLVGSNCSVEGVNAITAGTQYATVLQSPIDDGNYAAQAVADLLDGKSVPKTRFLPHPTITAENVAMCNAAIGR
ncbi:sugar ABC transporter substrate-binding protein [Acidisoma cellulosilytica]|uniref:Sugar ABC transporter substrate-binding protein n=1 Tax=Acidisoma cellulosilyticum TaxID=2802395 RepID=A0A963Z7Q3_9PROT|nr:sugar ABC transporter substrate-binding protein [Acidisoma cellulosilyticum]MCB8883580.1 sugar ABC transporter substrate-binding protein [Acidisoma cellulosilyticum]